jgi:hypothetical protein
MTNVLPEAGSVLSLIPATAGTKVRYRSIDGRSFFEYTVIAYAIWVDRAWRDAAAGVARYSTRVEPIIIVDEPYPHATPVAASFDGNKRGFVEAITVGRSRMSLDQLDDLPATETNSRRNDIAAARRIRPRRAR